MLLRGGNGVFVEVVVAVRVALMIMGESVIVEKLGMMKDAVSVGAWEGSGCGWGMGRLKNIVVGNVRPRRAAG